MYDEARTILAKGDTDLSPLTEEEQKRQLAERERLMKQADAADPERVRRGRKVTHGEASRTSEGKVRIRTPSKGLGQSANQAQAEDVVGDTRGPRQEGEQMSTKTGKSKEGKTTHRCTSCGHRFEGTGKRGRPFRRCPPCRESK